MSLQYVECKGSGQKAPGHNPNMKKSSCRWCQKSVEVASNGNLRKHTRRATKSQLRKGR